MGLEAQSSPVGNTAFSSPPFIPEIQLGNSPQPTVSPADPNLNMGPLGSPQVLNGHVINSSGSRNSSPVQANDSYTMGTVTKFKQEIV